MGVKDDEDQRADMIDRRSMCEYLTLANCGEENNLLMADLQSVKIFWEIVSFVGVMMVLKNNAIAVNPPSSAL